MEISSLDLAIRRIQNIENRFQALAENDIPKVADKFQTILNVAKQANEASGNKINELINEYSAKNGLDEDFVKALIKQESAFDVNAKSKAGAMGLMQLMPMTAKGLGVENAYDAEQNIAGGTKYLKSLLSKYDGNKEMALAAYNAGPTAVAKYGGIPPYMETQNYVKNVLNTYEKYKMQGGGV